MTHHRGLIALALGVIAVLSVIIYLWGPPALRLWREKRNIALAQSALARGDFSAARIALNVAFVANPNSILCHELAADYCLKSGSPDLVFHRRRIFELAPSLPAKIAWAKAALIRGDRLSAARALEVFGSDERDSEPFLEASAQLHFLEGQPKMAAECWERLLRVNPGNVPARLSLAQIQLNSDDPSIRGRAVRNLELLGNDREVRLAALRSLALYTLSQEELPQANQWSALLVKDSGAGFSDSLIRLSVLRRFAPVGFGVYLAELKARAAGQPDLVFALGRWMLAAGLPGVFLDWVNGLPEATRLTPPVPMVMADSFAALGAWPEIPRLLRSADWGRFDPLRYALLALAARAAGNREGEAIYLTRVANVAASEPEMQMPVVQILDAWGWRDAADDVLQQIAPRAPNPKPILSILLQRAKNSDNIGKLIRCQELALELQGPNHGIQRALATLYLLAGTNLGRARAIVEELETLAPEDPDVAELKALALVRADGESQRALDLLDRCAGQSKDPFTHQTIRGFALAQVGRPDEAYQLLEKIDLRSLPRPLALLLARETEIVKKRTNRSPLTEEL